MKSSICSVKSPAPHFATAALEIEMRLLLTLCVLLAVGGVPSVATAQQDNVIYHGMVMEEGDDRLLLMVATDAPRREFLVWAFDPQVPSGYTRYYGRYDCAATRRLVADERRVGWDGPYQGEEDFADRVERRFGIESEPFQRGILCGRLHEGGLTVVGYEQALAEGRQWQRLNATSAAMGRLSCEQLLELMSDAMTEYGFSPDFARISERTLAVARSKRCEWTNDFR